MRIAQVIFRPRSSARYAALGLALAGMVSLAGCADNASIRTEVSEPTSVSVAETSLVSRQDNLRNVQSLWGIPQASDEMGLSVLFDKGSWHGYGLGDGEHVNFSGPFLLTRNNGYWVSQNAPSLQLGQGAPACQLSEKYSLPGRLVATSQCGTLTIKSELVFGSGRSAITRTKITNQGDATITLTPRWVMSGMLGEVEFSRSASSDAIRGDFADSEAFFTTWASGGGRFDQSVSGLEISLDTLQLAQRSEVQFYLVQSAFFDEEDFTQKGVGIGLERAGLEQIFADNEQRWTSYVASVDELLGAQASEQQLRRLAIKSVQTLIGNWRSPAGDLTGHGVIPSYGVRYFHGFWAWDSWKHAAALARFDVELAKDQMRSMFAFQNERGMVADVVYSDASQNNWRDSKPPLSVWAVHEIFKRDGDLDFVAEMMPKMLAYHQWWYEDRDHDGDGMAEFGSTDGTRIAAAWESGMDNAVRFDDTSMEQSSPEAWSFNQESVDLNAYLVLEKRLLGELLDALGRGQEAVEFRQQADQLARRIREEMFDQSNGYFHDRHSTSHNLITTYGPEGWTPLWTGVANQRQASAIREAIIAPEKFDTFLPFPTLAADNPKFDPTNGYWRGPVWFDQAYFGISSLRKYGFHQDADRMMTKLFANADGLLSDEPIHENYHPETGAQLNAPHFSWSAAHILLMLEEAAAPRSD